MLFPCLFYLLLKEFLLEFQCIRHNNTKSIPTYTLSCTHIMYWSCCVHKIYIIISPFHILNGNLFKQLIANILNFNNKNILWKEFNLFWGISINNNNYLFIYWIWYFIKKNNKNSIRFHHEPTKYTRETTTTS